LAEARFFFGRAERTKMQQTLFRKLKLGAVSSDSRTVEASLSSEQPAPQFFGTEILSHATNAIDLSRAADGLPVLLYHDQTRPVGLAESVRIENRRLKASIRFFNTVDGDSALQLVREGLLNVSIGYQIDTMEQTAPGEFTATRWTLLETSIVSVPADQTVGVSRSLKLNYSGASKMENETLENETLHLSRSQRRGAAEAVEQERERINSINALGEKWNNRELARQLISGEYSLEAARSAFLERVVGKQMPIGESGDIGLSANEAKSFSIVRAINAQITGDWRKAGLERNASDAMAQKVGRESSGGFFVPQEIFTRAPYAVGAAATGGNIVATDLLSGSFIDVLRNQSMVLEAGATVLSGLVGNVAIPRRNLATAAYWVTEASAITEAESTFDQVTLSPKTIGTWSKYSRLTLLQSTPDIEMLIRKDMIAQIGLGIDLAAISGTGASGQPTGILNTSGVGSVIGGTNGAAITLDHLIQLFTSVATANAAQGNLAYFLNHKTIGNIAALKSTTGQYLWASGDDTSGQVANRPYMFQGKPIYGTNQMPSTLTKGTAVGTCNALIFGNWADLLIGEWGVLEVLPNPYGAGFNAGQVEIRAMQSVDIAVRHPASFAVMTDAL
jgi:HK97 family phage major capsid protein/HK97 family phage prohead protease